MVDQVRGRGNARSCADLYHLRGWARTSTRLIEACARRFGHVQIADQPGRGQPGTGVLDWPRCSAG